MQLLEWQNLIFLVPIAIGVLYVLMIALGAMGGEHGGDVSADHGASFDHAAVHHGDLSHADGAGDADHGHVAGDGHPGVAAAMFSFLGVGKVPLSILLMSYCLVWGSVGLIGLNLFPKNPLWPSIGLAAAAAVFGTRYLALGIGRLLPSVETYHTPLATLVGLDGEVLYEVTDNSGLVRICDDQKNQRDVSCRVATGAAHIPAGKTVVLQRYDAAAGVFLVRL